MESILKTRAGLAAKALQDGVPGELVYKTFGRTVSTARARKLRRMRPGGPFMYRWGLTNTGRRLYRWVPGLII